MSWPPKQDWPNRETSKQTAYLFVIDDAIVQRVNAKTHRIDVVAGNGNVPSQPPRLRKAENLPALSTTISPQSLTSGPNGTIFIAEEGAAAVLELRP
jgi:hypothetical protein